jgi:hypothetical protein
MKFALAKFTPLRNPKEAFLLYLFEIDLGLTGVRQVPWTFSAYELVNR